MSVFDRSVLTNLSLPKSNVCKITPARITSLSWHPSAENLIVAAGDKYGNFGLWNIKVCILSYLMISVLITRYSQESEALLFFSIPIPIYRQKRGKNSPFFTFVNRLKVLGLSKNQKKNYD